jgi:acyl-CoA reductase-like NAD-dependent aldehyde dehydrogenase
MRSWISPIGLQGSEMSAVEEILNFINGEWVRSRGGCTAPNYNPAHRRQILNHYQVSTGEDMSAAIDAAYAALAGWKSVPAPRRGDIVERAAQLMLERKEAIASALVQEEGKTLSEARAEVDRAVANVKFAASQGYRLGGNFIPSTVPGVMIYTTREPLGVVGAVTPWNFPVAIPAWKIAPALVSGNTVVLKPASLTPWTASLVVQCFVDAGLPPGVLNMVTGPGSTVGSVLVDDDRVRAISFTGSNEVGRALYTRAAHRLCKVQLEMGGKNPVIVLADADLEAAAEAITVGAFGSSGQRCTATSRVVAVSEVHDSLLEMVVERARKLVVGDGLDPTTHVGPLVDENQLSKVLGYIEAGVAEGAKLVLDGRELSDGLADEGYFVGPTVFTEVEPSMRIAQEEIFGPVLCFQRAKDFKQAMELANAVEFGLSSSIYTNDLTLALEYARRSQAGMLHVNIPTLGGEAQVPFGGIKGSGLGSRECGEAAFNFFTEEIVVYIQGRVYKART